MCFGPWISITFRFKDNEADLSRPPFTILHFFSRTSFQEISSSPNGHLFSFTSSAEAAASFTAETASRSSSPPPSLLLVSTFGRYYYSISMQSYNFLIRFGISFVPQWTSFMLLASCWCDLFSLGLFCLGGSILAIFITWLGFLELLMGAA